MLQIFICPMIWSYVFLLDFLIPFLCGPDLQCTVHCDALELDTALALRVVPTLNIKRYCNYHRLPYT
jgi:hypothetical protein